VHDSLELTLACDDDNQIQAHNVVLSARAGVHGQMINVDKGLLVVKLLSNEKCQTNYFLFFCIVFNTLCLTNLIQDTTDTSCIGP
jgi:hypothetical protein